MSYNVSAGSISIDINDEVRTSILSFLENYNFPYVTIVPNKKTLRTLFSDYFNDKRSLNWLKIRLDSMATQKKGMSVAMTEANRLHTAGLGNLLLSRGHTKCKTIHTRGKGEAQMHHSCKANLHNKILDIQEILKNSFPPKRIQLLQEDIPMIPQHVNCRHVMAPLEDS